MGVWMIYELRTYTIKIGKLKEFIEIYDKKIRKIHVKTLGNQLGFFYSEIGDLNQVVHLYAYKSYEDRENRRKILSEKQEFKNYINEVADMIVSQKNQLLKATEFSKI